jgi:hypothetical protein
VFNAPDDLDYGKQLVLWAAQQEIGDMLTNVADDFNRRTKRGGLVTMSMNVKYPSSVPPYPYREDLLRGLTCDSCGRDYGVFAIALFCPACGARNVHVHFAREIELIEKQLRLAEQITAAGDNELGHRLMGNAHEDVLTAFETYLKTLFRFLVKRRLEGDDRDRLLVAAKKGNPFQSIDRGMELFRLIGSGPYAVLSDEDMTALRALTSKRHVIGHNLGLADEQYLRVTGAERAGESVVLVASDVRRFAELAYRVVVQGLEEREIEMLPPSATGVPNATPSGDVPIKSSQ